MIKALIITLSFTLLAHSASAQLGESLQQTKKRYGNPKEETEAGAYSFKTYQKNEFTVTLTFYNGIVEGVAYIKDDLSSEEVATLLKQNANGKEWIKVSADNMTWHRSDKKAFATWEFDENKLLIFEFDTLEALKKLSTPAEGSQPYTPTKLEWLVLSMNATKRYDNIEKDGFSIEFMSLADPNTITLVVAYTAKAKQKDIESAIQTSKVFINQLVEAKGWDWVKIDSKVADLDALRIMARDIEMDEVQGHLKKK